MLYYLLTFLTLSSEGFKETPHWCFLHQNLSFILQAHIEGVGLLDEQLIDDFRHHQPLFLEKQTQTPHSPIPTLVKMKTKFSFIFYFVFPSLTKRKSNHQLHPQNEKVSNHQYHHQPHRPTSIKTQASNHYHKHRKPKSTNIKSLDQRSKIAKPKSTNTKNLNPNPGILD